MGVNKSRERDEVWILDNKTERVNITSLMCSIISLGESIKEKKLFLACSYDIETIQTTINQYNLEVVKISKDANNYFDALRKINKASK